MPDSRDRTARKLDQNANAIEKNKKIQELRSVLSNDLSTLKFATGLREIRADPIAINRSFSLRAAAPANKRISDEGVKDTMKNKGKNQQVSSAHSNDPATKLKNIRTDPILLEGIYPASSNEVLYGFDLQNKNPKIIDEKEAKNLRYKNDAIIKTTIEKIRKDEKANRVAAKRIEAETRIKEQQEAEQARLDQARFETEQTEILEEAILEPARFETEQPAILEQARLEQAILETEQTAKLEAEHISNLPNYLEVDASYRNGDSSSDGNQYQSFILEKNSSSTPPSPLPNYQVPLDDVYHLQTPFWRDTWLNESMENPVAAAIRAKYIGGSRRTLTTRRRNIKRRKRTPLLFSTRRKRRGFRKTRTRRRYVLRNFLDSSNR